MSSSRKKTIELDEAANILDFAVGAPLERVVDPDRAVRVEEAVVGEWRISGSARDCLLRWGLPAVVSAGFLEHHPQPDSAPRTSLSGVEFYGLGFCYRRALGIRVDSGQVWALASEEPYPEILVNSTPERYVECMWRWSRAAPVFVQLVDQTWDEEQIDFLDSRLHGFRRDVITRADPLTAGPESSLWERIIDYF